VFFSRGGDLVGPTVVERGRVAHGKQAFCTRDRIEKVRDSFIPTVLTGVHFNNYRHEDKYKKYIRGRFSLVRKRGC
jgi:hypothetical protein